jgi:F-type H+-transporting ATPase subunit gamma
VCPPRAEINNHIEPDATATRKLFLVISSDKGLCGGIHSSVSKFTRRALAGGEGINAAPDSPVMVVGDKSKMQLSRMAGPNMALTFNQIGRDIPTFADAAAVADLVKSSGVEYDSVVIVHNKFVSAISYEPTAVEIRGESAVAGACAYRVLSAWTREQQLTTTRWQPASRRMRRPRT